MSRKHGIQRTDLLSSAGVAMICRARKIGSDARCALQYLCMLSPGDRCQPPDEFDVGELWFSGTGTIAIP
jgi:hypothetical protein